MPATRTTAEELDRLEIKMGMDELVTRALDGWARIIARNGKVEEEAGLPE
jgi:hypothetical protein